MTGSKPLRVDQILSRYGYCSRREARSWLNDSRVLLDDGRPPASTSERVPVERVLVDGSPVEHPHGILAMLHKPTGYVSSHDSGEGPTIYELLPERWLQRDPPVTSVGRLDKDATGLILITDRGDLVHRWTSPKHHVPKVYEVTLAEDLPHGIEEVFASGKLILRSEDQPCLPAKLERLGPRHARLTLTEGRYHQVKRMFASQGCPVLTLHRTAFADYRLENLPEGQWMILPLATPP